MEKTDDITLKTGLYLVSTPVGNMRDITLRALDTLTAADLVLCEDTRVTAKLLTAYGLKKKTLSYNDHNAARRREKILEALAMGQAIALVSDAGTPLVSDPGYKLVRECLERGFLVTSLPGANALLPALQLSGLPSDRFAFLGFLPPRGEARRAALRPWAGTPATLLIFESAPRLAQSLADMAAVLGARPAAVVREITKKFEESRRGTLAELAAFYEPAPPKGEIVVVVGPPLAEEGADEDDLERRLRAALETMSVKDAAAFVAAATNVPRRTVYEMALRVAR